MHFALAQMSSRFRFANNAENRRAPASQCFVNFQPLKSDSEETWKTCAVDSDFAVGDGSKVVAYISSSGANIHLSASNNRSADAPRSRRGSASVKADGSKKERTSTPNLLPTSADLNKIRSLASAEKSKTVVNEVYSSALFKSSMRVILN